MIPITGIVHGKTPSLARIIRSDRDSSGLGVLVLNLTRTCPLKCVYCYASSTSKVLEIDAEVLLHNVLKRLDVLRPRIVILSGGEPLVYSRFWDILEVLTKFKVSTIISTSGLLLKEEHVKRLVEHLISYVGVSLDVPLQDVEKKLRLGSSVSRVVDTIRMLRRCGITTGIRMTLTWPSLSAVEKMFELCIYEHVDRLCIYHLVPSGRAFSTYSVLSIDDPVIRAKFLTFLVKLVEHHPEIDVLLVTEPSDMLAAALLSSTSEDEYYRKVMTWSRRTRCSALSGIVSVSPEGSVHPCQFMSNISLGNVYEKPLDEILAEAKRRGVNLARCKKCPYVEHCGGCSIRITYMGEELDPACALYALRVAASRGRIRLERWQIKVLQDWASTLHREA